MADTGRGTSTVAGKYLTFALAGEHYGVEILKVIEIIGVMNITRVPRCPAYMNGVINLRGKIIPVIDLRSKFGMERGTYDERTCTIIVTVHLNGQHIAIGMIVDTVLEVVEFDASKVEPPPEFGVNLDTRFILGMGRGQSDQVIILTDIDRIFAEGEGHALSNAATVEGIPALPA